MAWTGLHTAWTAWTGLHGLGWPAYGLDRRGRPAWPGLACIACRPPQATKSSAVPDQAVPDQHGPWPVDNTDAGLVNVWAHNALPAAILKTLNVRTNLVQLQTPNRPL